MKWGSCEQDLLPHLIGGKKAKDVGPNSIRLLAGSGLLGLLAWKVNQET